MAVSKRKSVRRTWTAADKKQLRDLIRQGMTGAAIAKRLKRSPASVYQYASAHALSFRAPARRGR